MTMIASASGVDEEAESPRLDAPGGRHPLIFLVTLATEDSLPWLTQPRVHLALRHAWWRTDDWLVGNYLLLPDRLHCFCGVRDSDSPLSWWMRRWQQRFLLLTAEPVWQWQEDHQQRPVPDTASYEAEWQRVRELPLRRGLAADAAKWPYQGCLHHLGCPSSAPYSGTRRTSE